MPKMGLQNSFGHLKHKLWPKQRPGIDMIFSRVSGVQHIVGKLLMSTKKLLQTLFRLEVYTQSYGGPKSREFNFGNFGTPI
jgi:hypothetical protein